MGTAINCLLTQESYGFTSLCSVLSPTALHYCFPDVWVATPPLHALCFKFSLFLVSDLQKFFLFAF